MESGDGQEPGLHSREGRMWRHEEHARAGGSLRKAQVGQAQCMPLAPLGFGGLLDLGGLGRRVWADAPLALGAGATRGESHAAHLGGASSSFQWAQVSQAQLLRRTLASLGCARRIMSLSALSTATSARMSRGVRRVKASQSMFSRLSLSMASDER